MTLCTNTTAYGSAPDFCGKPESHFVHDPSEHGACTDQRYCMYHAFETAATLTQQDRIIREFDAVADTVASLGRSIGFSGITKGPGMESVDAIVADLRRAIVRAS